MTINRLYAHTPIGDAIERTMMNHLNASDPIKEGPSDLGGDQEGDNPDALTRAIEQTCLELARENILVAAATDLITKEQALDAILRLRAKNAAWFAKRIFV